MTILNENEIDVPITKGGQSIKVDLSTFTDDVYKFIVAEGLKVLANKGMSKILTKGLEGKALEDAQAAAMTVATKNLDKLAKGEIKVAKSASAAKVSGKIMTAAVRLARDVVRNEIRNAGYAVSAIPAAEVTRLAKNLVANDPSYLEQAKAVVEAVESKAKIVHTKDEAEAEAIKADAKAKLAALGGVTESPILRAKIEATKAKAKADRKSTLSAKQAGKVAKRKKGDPLPLPEHQHTDHHTNH